MFNKQLSANYTTGGTVTEMDGTFTSYGGTDITAIFNYVDESGSPAQKIVGTLSSITISVVRQVTPQYRMGKAGYASLTKGQRSISGSMSFLVFDRHPLMRDLIVADQALKFETMWEKLSGGDQFIDGADRFAPYSDRYPSAGSYVQAARDIRSMVGQRRVKYADELLPFDVVLLFANEAGSASVMSVRGITLVSEGTGHSMHDGESNLVFSYIAQEYEPMTPVITKTTDSFMR